MSPSKGNFALSAAMAPAVANAISQTMNAAYPADPPDVYVLTFDCSPDGLASEGACRALLAAIQGASSQPGRRAIVLHGQHLFGDCGRADIASEAEALIGSVQGSSVPIVAALPDRVAGFGLELALACAGRVAGPRAMFDFPRALIGELPANAALTKLPRLVGVEAAAQLLVFGRTWDAKTATEAGLVDAVTSRDLPAFAALLANSLTTAPRHDLAFEPEGISALIYKLKLKVRQESPEQITPLAALRAIEAAVNLSPRKAALEIESIRRAFERTTEAEALRYVEAGAIELQDTVDVDRLISELRWPLLREAIHLIDEGAAPARVDRQLLKFGFTTVPFAQSDRIGLREVFNRQGRPISSADWITYSATLDLMLDAGRLGGVDTPGWYRHTSGGSAIFDPEVDALVKASATFQRLSRSPLSDETVSQRCLYAIMNGTASLLAVNPALKASELDAIWTSRLGFPRWLGGPLFLAKSLNPLATRAMQLGERSHRTAGQPEPTLMRINGQVTA